MAGYGSGSRIGRIRGALFVCGAALFLGLLIRIGPKMVMADVLGAAWLLPVLCLFPACVVTTCDALGWRFAFLRDRVPFWTLLGARLAGESFNVTTPTASVGGDAVKAWLVRPWVPLAESLPSVVVAKTTHTIGQVCFLLLGLVVARLTVSPGSAVLEAMQWGLLVELIAVGGFVAVQILGPIGVIGRILGRLGILEGDRHASTLKRLDENLAHLYRHDLRRLALSAVCHFAGWTLGVLETYMILRALDVPVSLATATVIEAFGTVVAFAAFLVPARLGAAEAGNVLVFAALGLSSPAALALALVQRLREAVWTGVGLLALLTLRGARRIPVLTPEG